MKKKIVLLSLFPLLLTGCSENNQPTSYDPFMIGDNLEVISRDEARLIANEGYDNLNLASSLMKQSKIVDDNTKFYTGAFASYATNKSTTTDSQVSYFSNKVEANRDVHATTYIGNNSTEETSNTATTEWYGIKPVKEGETSSEDYALLRRTIDNFNGVSSTRFSATDDFSSQSNVEAIWNRHLVKSMKDDYLNTDILYSDEYTYVRDNQHIVGYNLVNEITKESSKIAPGKPEVSYIKKVESLSVIDYYKDEVLNIGWTIRNVSSRIVVSYLTTIDGNETNPIEVSRQEDITSIQYESAHQKSEDIPEYVLTESIPFAISKFDVNSSKTDITYNTKYEMENNDDYYRHFEDSFSGHAYYKEQKLEVGFYSFFDGEVTDPKDYEKWGYAAIIANKCVNYIVDPSTLEDYETLVENHPKLFYVAAEATFAFRVVFDANMETANEFSVAIVGR